MSTITTKDLEVLITLDDPGEDELEEDTFHQRDSTGAHRSERRPEKPIPGGAASKLSASRQG